MDHGPIILSSPHLYWFLGTSLIEVVYVNLVNLTDEIVSNALFTLITRGCWFNFMKSLLDTLSCTFPTLSQGLAKKNFAEMCVLLEGTLTIVP